MFKTKRKAFTIVELLISIMIIGILAGLGYSQYTKAIMKANAAALLSQFKTTEAAMSQYYADTGTMPQQLTFLFDRNLPVGATGDVADLVDIFGFVSDNAMEEVLDYWGGPYMERVDTETIDPVTGNKINMIQSLTTCAGDIQKAANGVGESVCLKAKLGKQLCVGALVNGQNYYNVFIVDGINGDMVKELFTSANAKAIQNNAAGVANSSIADKLGAGKPADYTNENGCVIWRYYDSSLIK